MTGATFLCVTTDAEVRTARPLEEATIKLRHRARLAHSAPRHTCDPGADAPVRNPAINGLLNIRECAIPIRWQAIPYIRRRAPAHRPTATCALLSLDSRAFCLLKCVPISIADFKRTRYQSFPAFISNRISGAWGVIAIRRGFNARDD